VLVGGKGGFTTVGGTGGAGGSVGVTIGSVNMGVSSLFSAAGGNFSTAGSTGGDASISVTNLALGTSSSFSVAGGTGGTGTANLGAVTMVSGSQLTAQGINAAITVTALNGTGSVSVGNGGNLQITGGSFNGIINSGTLVENGGGSVTLNGATTLLSGANLIAGNFILGDASSPSAFLQGSVTVSSSASFYGYGKVNGTVTNSGLVLPGGSTGSLTFAQFNQTSNGTLDIHIKPGNDQSSFLSVSGASLDGNLGIISSVANYGFRDRYTLISGGAISGTFASFPTLIQGMDSHLIYDSNKVSLILLHPNVDFTAFATTLNGTNVALALNQSLLTESDSLSGKEGELFFLPSGQGTLLDQMGGEPLRRPAERPAGQPSI